MKKIILVIGMVALFIGMPTFASATNNAMEIDDQNNDPLNRYKYSYAKL